MINLLEFPAATLEWMELSPLLVLLIAGSLGILLEALVPRSARYVVQSGLALLSVGAALALTVINWSAGNILLAGMDLVALDGAAYLFWTVLLIAGLGGVALFAERGYGGQSAFASSAATVPGSPLEREADRQGNEHTEIFPLLLFALFGSFGAAMLGATVGAVIGGVL